MRLLTKNKGTITMIIKVEEVTYKHMETAYKAFKRGLRDWDSVSNTITENYFLYRDLVGKQNLSERIQGLYDTVANMQYGTIDQQKEAGINLVTMFS